MTYVSVRSRETRRRRPKRSATAATTKRKQRYARRMPTVTGRPHPPTGGPPTRARPRPPPRRRTGRGPARARPPRAPRDSGSRGGASREARRTARSTPRAAPWPSRLSATPGGDGRRRQADEDVGAFERVARRAADLLRVGVLREPRLDRVHVVDAAVVERPRTVAGGDVLGAGLHKELRRRDAGRAGPGENDPHVGEPLLHDLERVEQRREDHDRSAVLVVVEHWDLEIALEPLLDLEAAWRRDVLEVDPAEHGRDRLHDRHDLVHVLGRQAQREGVDPGDLLEDERFALHHRLGGARADVAETEHRGAVRHDRDGGLLDRQPVRFPGVVVDGHADARDARRVGHGEVVAGLDAHLPAHLDLPAQVHEERAVRDVDDLHALDRADPVHDLLAVRLVARLERDVARDRRLADDDQVDGADVAAALADRRGDPTEHAGLVQDLEPDREAVARAWSLHSGPPLPRCTRPFPVLTRRATPAASARYSTLLSRAPRGSTLQREVRDAEPHAPRGARDKGDPMIDVKTADRELQFYIRPQTFPVAIRMLNPGEEVAEKAERPARDFKKLSMNCQVIDMARRYGWMIALKIGRAHV